jgi:hypothetical protein
MKKLMLVCTAALFSVAVYAQENQQDSTRTETDQYRQDRQQQTEQNMDTTSMDSTSNQYREDAQQIKTEGEGAIDSVQQDATQMRDTLVEQGNNAGTELNNEAREMRDSVRSETEQMGTTIEQGAERATNKVENSVNATRDDLKQGATNTGNQVKQSAEQAGQATGVTPTTEAQSSSTMTSENSGENTTPSELEIVEGKEGPNNEVVYKFKGEMWYVDRESKQMVKADESKLIDSKHDVMVHEGTTTSKTKKSNKRGKN